MRRRRTRGTWFPTIGTTINSDNGENASGRFFQLVIPENSGPTLVTAVSPLTFDVPFEGDDITTAGSSLADIVGSEYILLRIVGKLFAARTSGLANSETTDNNPPVLFGAGFFVARANDASSGGGEDTPIGSATASERNDNYSPLETDTIREPWIWRRTWILGGYNPTQSRNAGGASPARIINFDNANYPPSTVQYGSVADGPHIDSRVKRRVRQDDRLFFAVSATQFPLGSPTDVSAELRVKGYLDYRLFGSLRKARNTSAF